MNIRIALAGNPNSGKTTLFNALTGSNQFVGNWPGVTVEKKEGKLKRDNSITVTDLPGIYSLSPYTLEETVARAYLLNEKPDVILNIVDGTNLERNLYLTTQLAELNIPVVIAINMMDIVRKNGDKIDIEKLSDKLGCKIVEISALKGLGIDEAAQAAIDAVHTHRPHRTHIFSGRIEHTLAHIEEAAIHDMPEERQRWYSVKLFERDKDVLKELDLDQSIIDHIEKDIKATEIELDDDAESIIANERYNYVTDIIGRCLVKSKRNKYNISDRVDKVITNRWAALPIFAVIMFLVYFISVSTVGTWATDWANDGLFGDGWHLYGKGQYEEAINNYADENLWSDEFIDIVESAVSQGVVGSKDILTSINDKDFGAFDEAYGAYADSLANAGFDISTYYENAFGENAENVPLPSDYGVWVRGVPVVVRTWLENANCAPWLESLIVDGIIGGVGAVLGFIPQITVLFILLAFLEACGYMSRIAFILDRIFRKFGLSGKSFIPMLIGVGCSVPGIMASRTIENERDRRMTIITTTFMPCSAKLPMVAMISSALFGGAWWVAPSAYFVGIMAIITSGVILKKAKAFVGEPAPFVMELPPYHMPTLSNILRSTWERVSSFVKKAGTIILLASMVIWAGSKFGIVDGTFKFDLDMELEASILGIIGGFICRIFTPLGFGNIKAAIATVMGLVAKEEVVSVFGVLDLEGMTKLSAYSFLIFNLLCAPCFAAMGAIRREMNSAKWTLFAISYQCIFAYAISLMVYQFGMAICGSISIIGFIFAALVFIAMIYMLFIKKEKKTSLVKKL